MAEPRRKVRLLLALTWVCCGRTGELIQLSTADFEWASCVRDAQAAGLTVTFRRGNTVEPRGPYSLHTSLCTDWLEPLGLKAGDTASLGLAIAEMRRAEVKAVLVALRRVSPDLENRALFGEVLFKRLLCPELTRPLCCCSLATPRSLPSGAIGSEKMNQIFGMVLATRPRLTQRLFLTNQTRHRPFSLTTAAARS